MIKISNWKVAGYTRLSKEDNENIESNSIVNQRELIDQYISSKEDLELVDYYIDDGYSGTNFNRPGFVRLLQDMKNKKINCIIVKDLSRFARNHIEADIYFENIFPALNIRFISVIENIDSFENPDSMDNLMVPFKNLLNDAYAKALELLRAHIETLDRVAEFLLEQETITGKEFMKIFHEVEGKHSEPKETEEVSVVADTEESAAKDVIAEDPSVVDEAVMENKIEVTDVDASQQSDEE